MRVGAWDGLATLPSPCPLTERAGGQCPRPRVRKRAGFTLVEVLVVTSVIAILLLILFPAFNAIRRSQRVKRTEATVGAMASGIAAYQNDYGLYPPAEFAPPGANRGNRSLVALLNAKGGRSAPYLPAAFYDHGEVRGPLLLDEWERPFVYFDTSVMKADTAHEYDLLGDRLVRPAKGASDYFNFGRFQLWSCGPNERNDNGRGKAQGCDDIANFVAN